MVYAISRVTKNMGMAMKINLQDKMPLVATLVGL
jgi:hypothetical protein